MGLIIFSLGCNRTNTDKIIVLYTPENVSINYSISCFLFEGEFANIINEKVISDPEIIHILQTEISSLQKNNNPAGAEDIRIKCLIQYSNRTDTLCLGENFGIFLNGTEMEDSPEILQLIKKEIY